MIKCARRVGEAKIEADQSASGECWEDLMIMREKPNCQARGAIHVIFVFFYLAGSFAAYLIQNAFSLVSISSIEFGHFSFSRFQWVMNFDAFHANKKVHCGTSIGARVPKARLRPPRRRTMRRSSR
jgi:hypothetical protein